MRILFSLLLLVTTFSVNAQSDKKLVDIKDVPFTILEKAPVYPGCKGDDNKELKKCFNRSIQKHIAKNFDTNLPNSLGLSVGQKRIILLFRINKSGVVDNIRVQAPHPKLKEECIRILKLLPKFYPGEQKGEFVGVKFTLPFRIDVSGPDKEN